LHKNLIFGIIISLFAIIFVIENNFFVSEKPSTIRGLEKISKSTQERFNAASILSTGLTRMYNIFNSNLVTKDNQIDKEASMEFLESLTDIIENLNIAVLGIKPQKKVKNGKYTYIPYDLDIRCSYEQFGKLIHKLETNDRLIQIDEFKLQNNVEKISKRKGLSNLMNHNIDMKISTISINK
jgi:Tfp pilus assembly protein PilO